MLLTVIDVFLFFIIQRLGPRAVEAVIGAVLLIIGGCFIVELFFAQPKFMSILGGFVPSLSDKSVLVAIGIIGATVMPHNLYKFLHLLFVGFFCS